MAPYRRWRGAADAPHICLGPVFALEELGGHVVNRPDHIVKELERARLNSSKQPQLMQEQWVRGKRWGSADQESGAFVAPSSAHTWPRWKKADKPKSASLSVGTSERSERRKFSAGE